MEQICPKRVFPFENKRSEERHWILHIWVNLGIKFHLKLTILIFWTKLVQNMYFRSKIKNVKSVIEFCIFKLVYVWSFTLDWQFWHFGPNLPKGAFLIENVKSEHRHWILHIRISLGINFHLKLPILIFWTKFWSISDQKLKSWRASLNSPYSS